MTEDRILEYLWVLINSSAISTDPEIVTVDDGIGEGIAGAVTIEDGEHRFAITVRTVGAAHNQPIKAADDDTVREAYNVRRSELEKMIEEGHDDLERNGCVSPEEVGRMLDEAMARGLAEREARLKADEAAHKKRVAR